MGEGVKFRPHPHKKRKKQDKTKIVQGKIFREKTLRDELVGAVDRRDYPKRVYYFQCIFSKYLHERLDSFLLEALLLQSLICQHSESTPIKTKLLRVWLSSLAKKRRKKNFKI